MSKAWYVLWSPTGFGNNTAKLVAVWEATKVDDQDAEMYYPTYMDRLRDKDVMVPLFPNYAFLKCTWHMGLEDRMRDYSGIFSTFLRPVGEMIPYSMSDQEMDQIRGTLSEQTELVQQWWHVGDLVINDRVMVKNLGIVGTISYFLPPSKAMIVTEMFNEVRQVPVRLGDLEKL